MEIPELTSIQLIIAATTIGFISGSVLISMLTGRRLRRLSNTEDPRNHRIRELEADLRASQRERADFAAALEAKTAEFETSVETLREVRTNLANNEAELHSLKDDLKGAVLKTRELRQELQDRATESVREHIRAQEAETELEVAKAGSEAVMGEIARLQEERKQLTNTMRILGDAFLPDEDLMNSQD